MTTVFAVSGSCPALNKLANKAASSSDGELFVEDLDRLECVELVLSSVIGGGFEWSVIGDCEEMLSTELESVSRVILELLSTAGLE